MDSSILNSVKKVLGIDDTYTAFDRDIIMHINSVFFTLAQIGVGMPEGFMIEDDSTTWTNFIENDILLSMVKTYVYLKTRMLFDPPSTSFHIEAMNKQIEQCEWRLNVYCETTAWRAGLPTEVGS